MTKSRRLILAALFFFIIAAPLVIGLVGEVRESDRRWGTIDRLRSRGVVVRIASQVWIVPRPTKATYGLDQSLHTRASAGTRFTSDDASDLNALPTITTVSLYGVAVDAETFGNLMKLQQVARLELTNCSFDDRQLQELVKSATLSFVSLEKTNVTPAGVEAARSAKPGLEIQRRRQID